MTISSSQNLFTRNIREWVTLAIVVFGFIYLTGEAKDSRDQSGYSSTAQFALESADNNERATNDVSGSNKPVEQSTDFLVNASVTVQIVESVKKVDKSNSDFANQTDHKNVRCNADTKNTLSLVDSDLAHQFTLVGEKPSGTS